MSNAFYLVLFLPVISFSQISVGDNAKMSRDEKSVIENYLQSHDKVVITSATSDSALFGVINQYRLKNNLNALKHSIRLDTLADKVIYQHLDTVEIVHYTQMQEMKPYRDLMSLENLEYGRGAISIDLDRIDKYVNIGDILQGWIDSPGHNRNLLAEAHIGTAKVIMIVRNDTKGTYSVTIRAIYEADYSISKRELDENIRKRNQKKFNRKIIIKKSGSQI